MKRCAAELNSDYPHIDPVITPHHSFCRYSDDEDYLCSVAWPTTRYEVTRAGTPYHNHTSFPQQRMCLNNINSRWHTVNTNNTRICPTLNNVKDFPEH